MTGASLNSTHNLIPKPNAAQSTVKFLCSYGGKILPRYPDGNLRYYGGQTRVLSVPRSVSFAGRGSDEYLIVAPCGKDQMVTGIRA